MRSIAVVLVAIVLAGCADARTINDRVVGSIGVANQLAQSHNIVGIDPPVACVKYRIVWGNVIWGAVLVETVIAPIYFFGFSMFEPTGEVIQGCTMPKA